MPATQVTTLAGPLGAIPVGSNARKTGRQGGTDVLPQLPVGLYVKS